MSRQAFHSHENSHRCELCVTDLNMFKYDNKKIGI